jgi:hypothetical protein
MPEKRLAESGEAVWANAVVLTVPGQPVFEDLRR